MIFSGGISGAGSRDFKIVRKSEKRRAKPASSDTTHREENSYEDLSAVNKVQKRADTGFNANNPCDASFEYNFPKTSASLGYIAVYGDQMIIQGGSRPNTWGVGRSRVTITSTVRPDATTRHSAINRKTCPGDRYPQVCANWRSIANNYGWRQVACPEHAVFFNSARGAVDEWYRDHDPEWQEWIQKRVQAPYLGGVVRPSNCQVDEWPPYDLWGSRNAGSVAAAAIYVRYLPGGENGGASNWHESGVSFVSDCKFL